MSLYEKNKFISHLVERFWPFFTVALISGIILPIVWGLVFSGSLALPASINIMQWHAHEMLYGLGGAVLGGFLLTSSKNWVKIRGIHGWPLIFLVMLWLLDRVLIFLPHQMPEPLYHLLTSGFVVGTASYVLFSLIKYRKNDSFRDNYFFYILLILWVVAKNLLLTEGSYTHGVYMSIGLFRLAFAVMFERTMTQFMKNSEGVELYRNTALDLAIKILVMAAIFQSFLPAPTAVFLLALAGLLLFIRWILWKPALGLKKFGNATMYVGYLGLILHFAAEAFRLHGITIGIGTTSLHIFTFICMGIVIPSMLVRISKGHTGRKPGFASVEKWAIILIATSGVLRLLFTNLFPEFYAKWILVSGIFWSLGFIALSVRLIPYLFRPRVDGKE